MMASRALAIDSGVSPGEAGGVFAGLTAAAYAAGKAVAWLLNWQGQRSNRREDRLRRWETSLDERERKYRVDVEHRLAEVETRMSLVSAALFETLAELQRLDPASPAIAQAREALQRAYPVTPELPEDLRRLLRRLDGRETEQ